MALVNTYFKDTCDLKEKFGKKSIVFIQVGAFYEVYGLLDPETNKISGSDISEFSSLCELAISKKNICIGKQNVLMAGVRDYMLDKYLRKMQGFGYTVAVYSQDEKAAGTTRSLTGIYSPGTFFSSETQKLTNNTMSIWLEKIQKTIVVGISNIDIYTGKSFVFEYNQEFSTTPEAYDELERYISIYQPSEIIVVHNLKASLVNDILHFVDLQTECRHIINREDKTSPHKQKVLNCEKQTYQREVIKKYFTIEEDNNLMQYPIGTQSYCYLLDFIFQHNPDLTRKIKMPQFENCTERLVLGNHSLKQLNIISSSLSGGSGSNGSIVDFLNQCKTPMGKRKFNYMMVNPLTDPEKLESEYNYCDYVMKKEDSMTVRDMLTQMRDLEKLTRKTALKKLTPADCFHMSFSLGIASDVYSHIENDNVSSEYLFNFKKVSRDVNSFGREISEYINTVLVLDKIKDKNTLTFDDNFIKNGYDNTHDKYVEQWYDSYDILIGIQKYFDEHVAQFEKNKKNTKTEYVKIHTTEKSGNSIICTSRRATILKQQLKGKNLEDIPYFSRYAKKTKSYPVDVSKLEFVKSTASNVTIICDEIKKLCILIRSAKDTMLSSLSTIYTRFLNELFNKYTDKLDEIVTFVALVDYSYTRAFIAKKYNLCKPSIKKNVDKSFFDIKGLRHILIESLLRNEHYVTNDLELNSNNLGVLLYGTNAVGKSSFIKAIGITIIMAQAGFYVPCDSLSFYPYKHIFTRILGNDNLFKGLSSFAVEMLELKTILNMATKDSLILGDELCSGTESSSAMSIFISGIQHLYREESNFVFATHFHEITDFEEVNAMEKMNLMHMAVHYDKSKDKLVYDRKLKDGPGQSMYGLEVCKSLHLPFEFLENANALRNKYNPQTGSILQWRQSRYNSKKLRGLCEECNQEFSTEVHHVAHQKDANDNGFIGSFHKNSLANLKSLCEKCHQKQHQPQQFKQI
tara:strand:- start:1574 stop:4480 length:2907 start_codon:yes stop_codon:yes gene_type:complete